MKYLIVILIVIGIIAIAKSINGDHKAFVAFKILLLLLICASVFAIISTFAFADIFKFLSKSSLFLAGFDFIYMVFRKLFGK